MKVVSIDPGETIGLAYINTITGNFLVEQVSSPQEAVEIVEEWHHTFWPDQFICEDYNSAGYLDKAKKHTIKVLGLFEFGHWACDLVHPQARLAFEDKAKDMIQKQENIREMRRNGRDAISALAHALAYAHSRDN